MKIAVSSVGPDLDSMIDPRFGRCQYFIFINSESLEFEAVQNTSAQASGGAGIGSAQLVVNYGAGIVITGDTGPNAAITLQAAGIKVFLGESGTVKDAIENYKAGKLTESSSPSVKAHVGMGQGRGMGRGRGRNN
jgi:predicted Fe-Mo cluster-binding NifX family protein